MKVLIVDDVPEILDCLEEQIRSRFNWVQIMHAENQDEAIKKYDSFNPDYVLLDIKLGRDSGLDVLKYFRKKNSKSKIIMVSNYTDAVLRKICLVLGANDFIDKSKQFDCIPDIIARYVRNAFLTVKHN